MRERTLQAAVELRWNDPATILAGAYWALVHRETGQAKRTTLHHLVGAVGLDTADQCVEAHIGFLADLLDALDGLQQTLAEALGDIDRAGGAVDPGSPLGATCRRSAAALDAHVYDLSLALHARGGALGERATRLVLDAAQTSVYLRSLVGTHEWPLPASSGE